MAALRSAFSMFIAVGMVALGAAAPASAEVSRVGVVTTLDGTATLSRVALPQGVPLKIRDDVFVADRIVTGDKSFARILLGGKAIVTVRERSVLNITEAPGTSTIDVSIGRVAVAVVKERMKPGESVEIRTPNAVAGIRGTVVVAEVDQTTSQLGATSGSFTTTITVLKGRIEFRQLDRLTRQPTGHGVAVGALQSIRVTGFAVPRPVQKVPGDVQQKLINDFRVPLRTASATTNSTIAEGQLRQAISAAGAQLGAVNTATPDTPVPAAKGDDRGSNGKTSEDDQGSNDKASRDNQSSSGNTGGSNQGRSAKTREDDQGSNGKTSRDNQGSSGNTSGSNQGRSAKTSEDDQGSNGKTSRDNQGSSENASGSNQGRKGNTKASENSGPSGNPGSLGNGGTSPVTGASGVSGAAPAVSAPPPAPPATSGGSTGARVTPAAPVVSVPPAASPTSSAGTTSVRSVPAPVVSVAPPVVTPPTQNARNHTSTQGAIQKAVEKASRSRRR